MMPKLIRCLILAGFLPCLLHAQIDTVPHIVTGQIDWKRTLASAPKFQQQDITVRIVRLNNITGVFEQEGSPAWQADWHYLELTNDRYLDGIYSGQTKFHKGWHTYLTLGDSSFKYPIIFSHHGYLNSMRYDSNGVEMILRQDPGEKEFITEISHHFYDRHKKSMSSRWSMRFVSTTEIPFMAPQPDQHVLKMPITLRTSAREVTEPAIDYDQDGRPDAVGNAVAEFPAGARLRRFAIVKENDLEWSFVTFLDPPAPNSVLKPGAGPGTVYAGWIPSGAFLK